MLKKYIGKNRAENLDWLMSVWLKDGPPVCFLQGFSGVGKTDLARDVREAAENQKTADGKPKWQQAVMNEIADRATPSVIESLMEVSETLSRQGLPEMKRVFEQKDPNLAYALEKALERPVVIIFDEAERFFRNDTGAPLPEMNGILSFLRNRQNLQGRLLLLSDRIVEEARWSEWIPKRTLKKLEPDEAVEALDTKLSETGLAVEIPLERKKEVVRDLDFNPRAIEALVAALRYETLDEIIGSNPGLWAVHDREVSRDFLKALERDLLERTMRHISEVHQRRLWRLAVHRRSFKREALEKLCGTKDEATELRSILVTRYLLNFYKGALSLNPIAREISLSHLREESVEFKQAHSGAADYHLRHFKAKQVVGSQSQLGESFAELRYHLVMAGRESELGVIGRRFTDHLKQEIKSVSPVPTDAEELDERIGVLTVLLGDGGAKGLEYHLARCLQSRGKLNDLKLATLHAARATGVGAPAASWYLRAELENQVEGLDAAMRTIYEAIHKVQADDNLFSLFQLGAELLGAVPGNTDEAVVLLKEGIKVIPPDKSLSSLYQISADLLAKAGKTDEAVALLKEGIKVIPPDKSLSSLYQISADLLAKAGKTDEAVALLKEGIKVIPPDKNLSSLYQMLGEVHCRAGNSDAALTELRIGVTQLKGREEQSKVMEAYLLLALASRRDDILTEVATAKPDAGVQRNGICLAEILCAESNEKWDSATKLAAAARTEFPRDHSLWGREAVNALSSGDIDAAFTAASHLGLGVSSPGAWLRGFIELRRGNHSEAKSILERFLGREPAAGEIAEEFLLSVWDELVAFPNAHRICFHLPVLSAEITRRPESSSRRVQFGKPVLSMKAAAAPVAGMAVPPVASSDEPEVYVSYAWGDDTSPEGIAREEVVNKMCEAVGRTGRVVGRDKTVMKPGDSIDAFANKIAKAPRIVAVISEKSLHSKFCMVDEIYSAYQRCGFRRDEFRLKVIALVMDDAAALLKNDIALVKHWKGVHENERTQLKEVDPENKALDRWAKVHRLGEMCDQLLNMMVAINDTIMPRGFEDITKDGFKEVINRLPTPASK